MKFGLNRQNLKLRFFWTKVSRLGLCLIIQHRQRHESLKNVIIREKTRPLEVYDERKLLRICLLYHEAIMDLFYQWVWMYAALDKFLFDLQILSGYSMISKIYTLYKLHFHWHRHRTSKFNDVFYHDVDEIFWPQSDRSNCVMWQVKDPCPRPGWDGCLAREKMAFIKSVKTWIILLYI